MKLAAAIVFSVLWVPAAFAHTSGHASSGGHFSGGAHFSGGGHYSGGYSGGAHYSAGNHYSAGAAHFAAPAAARNFAAARPTAYVGSTHAAIGGRMAAPAANVGRAVGAPALRGRAFGPGYSHFSHWGGGYWGGRFWPGAFYGPGFAWFLPTIPLYCATFWWNSVPYYYYNDIYYTWSPAADGYVATDPPPAATSAPPSGGDPSAASGEAPSDGAGAAAPAELSSDAIPPWDFLVGSGASGGAGGGSDRIFAYPANGQSEQKQAADRAECQQWAASQTGGASGSPDYRRAVIACYQGRGYSAQ
jgi:hypothetical protein